MRDLYENNVNRFISLSKTINNNLGGIDLLINPDLYSEKYGMTCRFLKKDHTLEKIQNELIKSNIKIIKTKDNMIRVVNNKTFIIKRVKNIIIGTLFTILFIILLLLQFNIIKICL